MLVMHTKKQRSKNKDLDDEIHFFTPFFGVAGWFNTLAIDSRHAWSLIGANIC